MITRQLYDIFAIAYLLLILTTYRLPAFLIYHLVKICRRNNISSSMGQCFLCSVECNQKCPRDHFYCCEDHLKAHGIDDYCFPYEIQETEEFGR